jgi:ABC-type transport system substrate-binding protein
MTERCGWLASIRGGRLALVAVILMAGLTATPAGAAESHTASQDGLTYTFNHKNVKVDDLLDVALRSTDRKVREKVYQDAARIMVEEAPGVWIYNTKYFGPWAKSLDGIRFNPIGNGQEMRWVYSAK